MGRTRLHSIALTAAAVATLFAAAPAGANQGICAPEGAHIQANAWVNRIAAAPTLDEARELALQPTQGAHFALAQAQRFAPWTDSLAEADVELAAYETRVNDATTPEAIADAAAVFVAGAPTGVKPDVGAGGCSYSTGEVIAIVIGFVLGIIPGIILMFLLC